MKVVNLIVVFSRKYRWPEHYSCIWSSGNSQKLLKTNQFVVSTISFTIMNISFFSLRFDLFSIIAKDVSQSRNNVVCVVARLVFLFCCVLTTDRCHAFQHNFEEIRVLRPVFLDYIISCDDEQMQQQQNGIDREPTIILHENGLQTNVNNNTNRGQRMKWTEQLNIDIICCYFNTILRIPNQPCRRDFHTRWTTQHPGNSLTEQNL